MFRLANTLTRPCLSARGHLLAEVYLRRHDLCALPDISFTTVFRLA
jgi:hypothetical protein